MLRLIVGWKGTVRYYPLDSDLEVSLGSAEGNEIHVPCPGISRVHARVKRWEQGAVFTDAGSKNGLIGEDGARHRELFLLPGGLLHLGLAQVRLEEISTSDVEAALELDSRASHRRAGEGSLRRDSSSGTGEIEGQGHTSAASAIGLIRRLERMSTADRASRRSEVLESARRVLGARSMSIVSQQQGVSTIIAHAGAAPSDELLGSLEVFTPPSGAEDALLDEVLGEFSVIVSYGCRTNGEGLAVVFDERPLGTWKRDFVSYLVGKLVPPGKEASTTAAPPPSAFEPNLDVPKGMILGSSPAMDGLLRHLRITVKSDLDVLLLGETGTGKELFARLIHRSGPTAGGPFVPVNCAAIPSELLEAELFGVTAGAATGVDARSGHFMEANGGTIFLDEITEMSGHLHAKLLRALQEREVLPVGSSKARKITVRVISACNRDLGTMVREGKFRADLFYRLRRLQFHIPPLRERREDLPEILLSFIERFAVKCEKRITGVSRKALGLLMEHDWPGNIRELETEVERAVLLCPDGATLQADHFGSVKWEVEQRRLHRGADGTGATQEDTASRPGPASELQGKLDVVEREAIVAALARAGGNKTKAATYLGVTRNGLRLKMLRLGVKWP